MTTAWNVYLLLFLHVKMSENLQISFYCTIIYDLTFVGNIMLSQRSLIAGKILLCGKGHKVLWCLFLRKEMKWKKEEIKWEMSDLLALLYYRGLWRMLSHYNIVLLPKGNGFLWGAILAEHLLFIALFEHERMWQDKWWSNSLLIESKLSEHLKLLD